jgi:kynurenine formamidase
MERLPFQWNTWPHVDGSEARLQPEERHAVSDPLLTLLGGAITTFDLGRPLFEGMPQSPNHPEFKHSFPRQHGDAVRPDGSSAANDLLVMGTHVGTHIDALAHVSHEGRLHGGADASLKGEGARFLAHGAHTIEPMVRRAVLLDVPRALGKDVLEPAYLITPDDLDATVRRQHVEVGEGDVVLIRSGWGRRFDEGTDAYLGVATGVPGIGEAGAHWLADRRVHAAGADTIAFEQIPPGDGHRLLPAHRVLLVESGIYIIETLALEELAQEEVYAFTLVLVPMKIIGATGSPVRPLALVASG